MNSLTNNEEFVAVITEINEKVPFNRVLGLKVESIHSDVSSTYRRAVALRSKAIPPG